MTLDQAGKVKNTEIAKELSLPPVKLHCSMLAEDAIKVRPSISDLSILEKKGREGEREGTELKLTFSSPFPSASF